MAITERTRACGVCNRILPEIPEDALEQRPVCTGCGKRACPHHATWPMYLKWWVIVEAARARFLSHLSDQAVWERLLADSLNGSRWGAHANPDGFKQNTPVVDLYPEALRRAKAWKDAGSLIARAIRPTRSSHVA